jgi:hypothetical protein
MEFTLREKYQTKFCMKLICLDNYTFITLTVALRLLSLLNYSLLHIKFMSLWISEHNISPPDSICSARISSLSGDLYLLPSQWYGVTFCNMQISWNEYLLASCPTLKLEDHPLLAVCNCLLNIFTATLNIWRPFPPSTTWGHPMPWWEGTHFNVEQQNCRFNQITSLKYNA